METNTTKSKKVYTQPSMTSYGNVAELTQQNKLKTLGVQDDFQIAGITNP